MLSLISALAARKRLMNDGAAARESYGRMLDSWKASDSQLKPLEEARAEYARLR